MKQPYIGNTKINKLYKGSELWCNWSSGGGDTPIEPSTGYVTDNLMICCDAYGKTSADIFDGFYDIINNKKFNLISGSGNYGTNCLNLDAAYLIYGNNTDEYGTILKKSIKNTSFEIVLKTGSYNNSWMSILTMGKYTSTPFTIRTNVNTMGGNKVMFFMTDNDHYKYTIRCLDKTKYWNHLIISIDGDGLAKIYVNGQYSGTHNTVSFDNDDSHYNPGLYIGYSNPGDCPLMSIGCIRYYHKALTQSEVTQNYQYEQSITRITTLNFPALDDSYEERIN